MHDFYKRIFNEIWETTDPRFTEIWWGLIAVGQILIMTMTCFDQTQNFLVKSFLRSKFYNCWKLSSKFFGFISIFIKSYLNRFNFLAISPVNIALPQETHKKATLIDWRIFVVWWNEICFDEEIIFRVTSSNWNRFPFILKDAE